MPESTFISYLDGTLTLSANINKYGFTAANINLPHDGT